MDVRLLLLPVVGGLIGWLTNHLAVKMLFRPRAPVRLPGCVFQGLVPRRRAELARAVGEVVERELVSHSDVHAVLSDHGFVRGVRHRLAEQIDAFLRRRVIGKSVWLRVAFSTSAVMKLKERVTDEVMASLPEMLESLGEEMKGRLRFRELVEAKIEAFELERLENTVRKVAGNELRAIKLFGAIIGFLIGLTQMGILMLVA